MDGRFPELLGEETGGEEEDGIGGEGRAGGEDGIEEDTKVGSARIGGIEDCDDEFGNAEVGNGGGTDDTG